MVYVLGGEHNLAAVLKRVLQGNLTNFSIFGLVVQKMAGFKAQKAGGSFKKSQKFGFDDGRQTRN